MKAKKYSSPRCGGFTLIELSIVLVIIGLIVGGVLAGQDLVRAAEVRATITQIEKYNTAANTFRNKYSALPGDLAATTASQFGFTARGSYAGEGDGNGLLEGVDSNAAGHDFGTLSLSGENAMFWVDLSNANGMNVNLIDGSFSAAQPTVIPASGINIALYLPPAKLGRNNYIYVWSGGLNSNGPGTGDGTNYFGIASAVTNVTAQLVDTPSMTPLQAYAIDKKIDDGFPQSGNVTALFAGRSSAYATFGVFWASGGTSQGASPATSAAQTTTTCYDNGGGSAAMTYSLGALANGGTGTNCALSFRFQ